MKLKYKRNMIMIVPVAVALGVVGALLYGVLALAGAPQGVPVPITQDMAAMEDDAAAEEKAQAMLAEGEIDRAASSHRMTGSADSGLIMAEGTMDNITDETDKKIEEQIAAEDNACDFSDWVGHPVPHEELESLGRPYRVLKPGAIVTMDFLPERINVNVDDEGIVTAVDCG